MPDQVAMIETALRVLTAVTEKRLPDPADMETLRSYAPVLEDFPPDELACHIIQQSLRVYAQSPAA